MQDIFLVSKMPDVTKCEGNDSTWNTSDSRSMSGNFNKIVSQATATGNHLQQSDSGVKIEFSGTSFSFPVCPLIFVAKRNQSKDNVLRTRVCPLGANFYWNYSGHPIPNFTPQSWLISLFRKTPHFHRRPTLIEWEGRKIYRQYGGQRDYCIADFLIGAPRLCGAWMSLDDR